jgi:uncharacterized membrane protein
MSAVPPWVMGIVCFHILCSRCLSRRYCFCQSCPWSLVSSRSCTFLRAFSLLPWLPVILHALAVCPAAPSNMRSISPGRNVTRHGTTPSLTLGDGCSFLVDDNFYGGLEPYFFWTNHFLVFFSSFVVTVTVTVNRWRRS